MISNAFYNKKNTRKWFFNGKIEHFPAKEPSVTLEWYSYTIKANENLFTITQKVFGKNLEHMWTLIADNNPPRHPDSWKSGDIIKLPKVIIKDSDIRLSSNE